MKLPLSVLRERPGMDIQMTPLIDVVFLLLVFFVWTAGFQLAEQVLPSHVAAEAPAVSASGDTTDTDPPPPEADFERIVVRVRSTTEGPRWEINDEPLATVADVRTRLQRVAEITADVPVILHPDGDIPLHHVIVVYDAARQLGFTRVSMAAAVPR